MFWINRSHRQTHTEGAAGRQYTRRTVPLLSTQNPRTRAPEHAGLPTHFEVCRGGGTLWREAAVGGHEVTRWWRRLASSSCRVKRSRAWAVDATAPATEATSVASRLAPDLWQRHQPRCDAGEAARNAQKEARGMTVETRHRQVRRLAARGASPSAPSLPPNPVCVAATGREF